MAGYGLGFCCHCASSPPNCFGCTGSVPSTVSIDTPTSLLFTCALADSCLYSEAAVGVSYNSREYEYIFPDPADEHGVQTLTQVGSTCVWVLDKHITKRFNYATGNGTNLTPYGTACQTGMNEITAPAPGEACDDHSSCGTVACTGTGGTAFDKRAFYTCRCVQFGFEYQLSVATVSSVLSWRLDVTVDGVEHVRLRSYARASTSDPFSNYGDRYPFTSSLSSGAAETAATCSDFPTRSSANWVYTKAIDCSTDFTGSPVVLSYNATETAAINTGGVAHPDMTLTIPATISIDVVP